MLPGGRLEDLEVDPHEVVGGGIADALVHERRVLEIGEEERQVVHGHALGGRHGHEAEERQREEDAADGRHEHEISPSGSEVVPR